MKGGFKLEEGGGHFIGRSEQVACVGYFCGKLFAFWIVMRNSVEKLIGSLLVT